MYHSESKEKPGRLQRLASSRALDRGVLLAIIVNSVLLALTAAMENEPKYDTWQGGLELALFVLFLLEFLVKVAAWGRAYFYDPWNLIDAAVVAEGVYTHPVTIILQALGVSTKKQANVSLSALRIMRLLRPLRTLKRFPEMRLLVESLLNSGQLLLVGFAVVAAAIYAFAARRRADLVSARLRRTRVRARSAGRSPRGRGASRNAFDSTELESSDVRSGPPNRRTIPAQVCGRRGRERVVRGPSTRARRDEAPGAGGASIDERRSPARSRAESSGTRPREEPLEVSASHSPFCRPGGHARSGAAAPGWFAVGRRARARRARTERRPVVRGARAGADRARSRRAAGRAPRARRPGLLRRRAEPPLRRVPVLRRGGLRRRPRGTRRAPRARRPHAPRAGPRPERRRARRALARRRAELGRAFPAAPGRGGSRSLARPLPPRPSSSERLERRRNASDADLFANRALCGQRGRRCAGPRDAVADVASAAFGAAGARYVVRERCVDVAYGLGGDVLKRDAGPRPPPPGDPAPRRFDTVGWAFMAVFDLTNLEGWHDVLWAARDAEGPAVWVYFAALVVALNLVALNAFPAIIAFSLRSAIREEENRLGREAKRALGAGAMGLSALEEAAVDMLAAEREDLADVAAALDRAARGGARRAAADAAAAAAAAAYPRGRWRVAAREVAEPPLGRFQLAVYAAIFANIAVLASAPPRPGAAARRRYERANDAFAGLFAAELGFKVFGFGPAGYWADRYNRFDAALVALAVAQAASSAAPPVFGALRVLRVAKLGRVFRVAAVARVARVRRMTDAQPPASAPERPGRARARAGRRRTGGRRPRRQMDFSRLVGVLTSSGVWLANIVALAGLACYMFAVLGMIFFRENVYALDGDAGAAYARADRGAGPGARACPAAGRRLACRGRFNFDSFPMAFMTVVLVASLDGWNDARPRAEAGRRAAAAALGAARARPRGRRVARRSDEPRARAGRAAGRPRRRRRPRRPPRAGALRGAPRGVRLLGPRGDVRLLRARRRLAPLRRRVHDHRHRLRPSRARLRHGRPPQRARHHGRGDDGRARGGPRGEAARVRRVARARGARRRRRGRGARGRGRGARRRPRRRRRRRRGRADAARAPRRRRPVARALRAGVPGPPVLRRRLREPRVDRGHPRRHPRVREPPRRRAGRVRRRPARGPQASPRIADPRRRGQRVRRRVRRGVRRRGRRARRRAPREGPRRNHPLVWGVPATLRNSRARSTRSRFGRVLDESIRVSTRVRATVAPRAPRGAFAERGRLARPGGRARRRRRPRTSATP